jgi:hypothetical protein
VPEGAEEEEGAEGAREEGAGLLPWELSAYGAGAMPMRGCCLRIVKPVDGGGRGQRAGSGKVSGVRAEGNVAGGRYSSCTSRVL